MKNWKFYLAISVVPGLIAAGIVSRHYRKNPITGKFRYLPIDPILERQISRKLMRTWGEKQFQKHTTSANHRLSAIWEDLKLKSNLVLCGKLYFLNTPEKILKLLPTGDLFISSGFIENLQEDTQKIVIAHELAHLQLFHAQDSLGYSKITALIVAWLCRHNHHFTKKLKNYLIYPTYSEQHEFEANAFVKKTLNSEFLNFYCENSLK